MSNTKIASRTYDPTRKLGALIPLEEEVTKNKEVKISQLTLNEVRIARNEPSWNAVDTRKIREAALCKVNHYYRALKANAETSIEVAELDKLKFNREDIVLEIMKGMSVEEAFRECCGDLNISG